MKCKAHPYERGAGVCASCLRERLLALVAAQNGLPADLCSRPVPLPVPPPPPPAPVSFPRSVSPYLSHRRSFGSSAEPPNQTPRRYLRRFYSTPQPRQAAAIDEGTVRRSKFSLLSILFGHSRSEAVDPDLEKPKGSWFSVLIGGGRRRRNLRPFPLDERPPAATKGRTWRPSDKGMSPAREDDSDESSSGCSTDSSSEWRRPTPTPMRKIPAAARRRDHRPRGGGGISGFAVCLSPLVRASPRMAEVGPSDPRNVLGACPTLAPNRSRKLVDIGRFQ